MVGSEAAFALLALYQRLFEVCEVTGRFEDFGGCDYAGLDFYYAVWLHEEVSEFVLYSSFECCAWSAEGYESADASVDFIAWPEEASAFG